MNLRGCTKGAIAYTTPKHTYTNIHTIKLINYYICTDYNNHLIN